MSERPREDRFDDFFAAGLYVALKNSLYNYRVRQRAIRRALPERNALGQTLEVGSGISPILTDVDRIVYSDLSPRALQTLRRVHGRGRYVAADCTRLPFCDGAFVRVVCSEVLEHIEDDRAAIREMARVLRPDGVAVVTFPHREAYFGIADRYVHHFRRYEAEGMCARLVEGGFDPHPPQPVLGLIEKCVMTPVVWLVSRLLREQGLEGRAPLPRCAVAALVPAVRAINWVLVGICRVEAVIVPLRFATVLLVKARRRLR